MWPGAQPMMIIPHGECVGVSCTSSISSLTSIYRLTRQFLLSTGAWPALLLWITLLTYKEELWGTRYSACGDQRNISVHMWEVSCSQLVTSSTKWNSPVLWETKSSGYVKKLLWADWVINMIESSTSEQHNEGYNFSLSCSSQWPHK